MSYSVAILMVLLVCAAAVNRTSSHKVGDKDYTAEVLWDTWGVPHIFSDTETGLCFGFGYAHARDHGNLLMEMAAIAAGRSAEFKGPIPWESLDINSYNNRIPQISAMLYAEMDTATILKYEAFATGFELYTQYFPDEYPRDEGFNQMLPMNGLDWFRTNYRVLYSIAFKKIGQLQIEMEKRWDNVSDPRRAEREAGGKTHTSFLKLDPLAWSGINEKLREVIGSNAWAVNSVKSSSGNAMLNMNPHLPYFNYFKWYEAQLKCEACGIDIYGANLVGTPGLMIAFNDYLGWTHTINSGYAYSAFELQLNPENDNQYLYDGEWLDFEVEENVIKILYPSGMFREKTIVNEYSVHGKIAARTDGRAMALRIAGIDTTVKRPNALKQWWDMGKAKSLDEFKDVMRQLQIPLFYTAVATRDEDIMMNWNGFVPDRGEAQCSRKLSEVQIVDGSFSENVWDSILPWDQLPTVINPPQGFVQNTNEPPWSMAAPIGEGPLNPDKYCQYIVSDSNLVPRMGYRSQVSWRLMSENNNMTYGRFLELKMSTLKEATNHVLDDLLAAIDELGAEDLAEAARILSQWDRHMDTTSVGSILFESFLNLAPSPLYLNPWSPDDPLRTPNTLANREAAVNALRVAVITEDLLGRSLSTRWGDFNRLPDGNTGETVAGNGCADCFRNCRWVLGRPVGGDSFVGVVEFTKKGPKAKVSVVYGNASPNSRGGRDLGHIYDQARLFSAKALRDVWRTYEEIVSNLEERANISNKKNKKMIKNFFQKYLVPQ